MKLRGGQCLVTYPGHPVGKCIGLGESQPFDSLGLLLTLTIVSTKAKEQ